MELSRGLCDHWGGGPGMGVPSKREGRYAHIELIHFVLQQKLTEYCKAIMLQEKQITK